jgi:hypothetical protein
MASRECFDLFHSMVARDCPGLIPEGKYIAVSAGWFAKRGEGRSRIESLIRIIISNGFILLLEFYDDLYSISYQAVCNMHVATLPCFPSL